MVLCFPLKLNKRNRIPQLPAKQESWVGGEDEDVCQASTCLMYAQTAVLLVLLFLLKTNPETPVL
jgi:hypothetical protein